VIERAGGDESGALQAGGHRFDPGHVHHIFNHLPPWLRILTLLVT
jgi:hypothetical protein